MVIRGPTSRSGLGGISINLWRIWFRRNDCGTHGQAKIHSRVKNRQLATTPRTPIVQAHAQATLGQLFNSFIRPFAPPLVFISQRIDPTTSAAPGRRHIDRNRLRSSEAAYLCLVQPASSTARRTDGTTCHISSDGSLSLIPDTHRTLLTG